MDNTFPRNAGPRYTNNMLYVGVLALIVGLALLAGAVRLRHELVPGPIFLHPGSADAAQRMVHVSFSDVGTVSEPVITGDRIVTLSAKIAQKDCRVQLYSPAQLSNEYGWTIDKLECATSAKDAK